MGSELIPRYWCDRCRAGDGAGFHRGIRLTIGPDTDRVLDLCGPCWDELLEPAVESLGHLGEEPRTRGKGANVAAPKATSSAAQPPLPAAPGRRASRSSPDPAERQQCPFCPSQSSSQNGLKQHIRVHHGLTWSQYQQGQPPIRGVQPEVA